MNTQDIQSSNAAEPKPKLLAYSATKAAIVNFTGGLAQLVAEKGIRVNSSNDRVRRSSNDEDFNSFPRFHQ